MIFSQLFSPNYKSNDPDKRIASIEKLNAKAEKDRRILHELAFNDANDEVSLAALHKLNSFSLWMKSSESSASTRIKKQAQQMCQTLLEDANIVSEDLFKTYISESKSKPLLEQLLFSSKRLQAHDSLCIEILFSLNNNNHLRRFFLEHASESQQLEIVERVDDAKLLSRLGKSTESENVAKRIDEKLTKLSMMVEKPIKIKQQVTMINSRLLALKDAQDYEHLNRQYEQLSDEFDEVKADFHYLDELSQATLTEKYLGLKVDVQQQLSKLEETHKAQLLLKQTTNDISEIQERCAQVQNQIDLLAQVHTAGNSNNIDAEVKILSSALSDASDELDGVKQRAQTQAHAHHIERLMNTIRQQQLQLSSVFDVRAFAQKGRSIIETLNDIISNYQDASAIAQKSSEQTEVDSPLTNKSKSAVSASKPSIVSRQEIVALKAQIDDLKNAFSTLKTEAKGLLPQQISQEFSHVLNTANRLVKHLNEYYRQLEAKCESKLKAINRLIKDGKFKAAMAMFHQVQKLYQSVSENASMRLQKAFEDTNEEVNKLQDWQAYIAQPRKPALLKQAESLANSQFEDAFERAHSVKELRQQWNSLGQLHTAEDEADNKAFDVFIEKAFVPCRAFFAELERQREQNHQKALAIIEEAKALDANLPASELASKMGALKSKFSAVGELEKPLVNKVKREFSRVLKPLSAVISEAQKQNATQKQNLVNQAQKLDQESTDEEALFDAIEKAKSLQQKWKQIGFAGKNTDNALWQAFRQANDALFNRYHKSINEKRDAQQAEYTAIDKEINGIITKVKSAKSLSDLQFYEQERAKLLTIAGETDEGNSAKVLGKLNKLDDVYEQTSLKLREVREASALSELFTFLENYSTQDLPDAYENLLGKYKTWVTGKVSEHELLTNLDRLALCQVASILLNVPFVDMPIGEESSRQELQLKIMASKLQGESEISPESVLAKWVNLGPVNKVDEASLQAMKTLFVK